MPSSPFYEHCNKAEPFGNQIRIMGLHDLTPPPGVRLKPAVLQFFKQYFDQVDDPQNVEKFSDNFTDDALWIHGNNSQHKGKAAIQRLKHSFFANGATWQSKLHHIYPLNQGQNGNLYILTGVSEVKVPPMNEAVKREFVISLKLVDVPGEGLKIKVANSAGTGCPFVEEDWFQNAARDLGMFRHS